MKDQILNVSDDEKQTVDLLLKLSKIRKDNHITQKELSSRTGIPQNKISSYENLRIFPRLDTVIKILSALNAKLKID